jgi:hypothetical protein
MPISNNYQCQLLLFLAMVIVPSVKSALSADVTSQFAVNGADPGVTSTSAEIPTGFKLERYAKVWERNPFTLVAPSITQPPHSAFEKLFLTSWLKNGHQEVVFIQNLETYAVQKITAEPNQEHLRLISLHVGPNPRAVEALVSNGQEQGTLKFRMDSQPGAVQTDRPANQMTSAGTRNSVQTVSAQAQVNSANPQVISSPGNVGAQPFTRRPGSRNPGVSMGTDPRQIPRPGHGSEGVHLSLPQKSS